MIFPTIISKSKLPTSAINKEHIFDIVRRNTNEDGYSMDFLGYTTIHHEPLLFDLYKQVIEFVREHLTYMNVDHANLDINVVKSWLNLTESKTNLRHNHSEAHYSFTIYPHIAEKSAKYLRFFRKDNHPNEIYEGFFENSCIDWGIQNSTSCNFLPEEGDVFIFPSTIDHDTVLLDGTTPTGLEPANNINDMRICIGGDIIITSKTKNLNQRILQPISDWRTFE
jgi:hypothetical protein